MANNIKLEKTYKELEKLEKSFVIKGVPEEYKEIWLPKKEVRLWSIPRSTGELLKQFVLASKAKTILELGTSAGYSTLWLASAAKLTKGKVTTIELARPKIKMAKQYFRKSGLKNYIQQIEGEIGSVLKWYSKKVDFLFMDADKKNYLQYMKSIEPHLKVGSVIVADNAVDFGSLMKDFLTYMQTSSKYESTLLKVDHGLLIAVKVR